MLILDKKFPPSHEARVNRLKAAYDAYKRGMDVLKKKRMAIMNKFVKRVDAEKIEDVKKRLEKL
jgi:hypothetical protein